MVHEVLGARQIRREETIQSIISAALHVLSTEGLEGLTMQRLAKEISCAPGAFYRYFRSKEEILVGVVARTIDRIREDLEDALAHVDAHVERSKKLSPGAAALLRIIVAGRVYQAMAASRPVEFRLVSMLIGDPRIFLSQKVAAERLLPSALDLSTRIEVLFADAAAQGALGPGDARQRSTIFWASLQGVMQLSKLDRFQLPGFDSSKLGVQLTHMILLGCDVEPEQLADCEQRANRIMRSREK